MSSSDKEGNSLNLSACMAEYVNLIFLSVKWDGIL